MKVKVLCRKLYDCVRCNLREIAFPSHIKKVPQNDLARALLAIAARGRIETLRPALQRLYMTRAFAYKDALKSFIEGYQEVSSRSWRKKKILLKHSKKAILIKIQLDG